MMLAIGEDELKDSPDLGDCVTCWICGKDHPVQFGKMKVGDEWVESKLIAYFKCGKKAYLCGVEGKEVRPK